MSRRANQDEQAILIEIARGNVVAGAEHITTEMANQELKRQIAQANTTPPNQTVSAVNGSQLLDNSQTRTING